MQQLGRIQLGRKISRLGRERHPVEAERLVGLVADVVDESQTAGRLRSRGIEPVGLVQQLPGQVVVLRGPGQQEPDLHARGIGRVQVLLCLLNQFFHPALSPVGRAGERERQGGLGEDLRIFWVFPGLLEEPGGQRSLGFYFLYRRG